jgi:hypothetical protein
VANEVAVTSVVVTGTVAVATLGVQVWQAHLNRRTEPLEWLRDRRTEAYLALLPLFVKTPQDLHEDEFPQLGPGSTPLLALKSRLFYTQWADAVRQAKTMPDQSLEDAAYKTVY